MKTTVSNGEIKRQNRIKVAKYILEHKTVSRQEIAVALGFSMPTVFQNVNELIEWGLVCEGGEYGSTGGRKAKMLKIHKDFRYVVGAEISMHHVRLLLLDLSWNILDSEYSRLTYENTQDYYVRLGDMIQSFVKRNKLDCRNSDRFIGVGISIPGIIDHDLGVLRESQALKAMNVSMRHFTQNIPYDFYCDNDANNAAYAEIDNKQKNTIYLSLSSTVGGAIYLGGELYKGDNFRSAEFGHTILVPQGRNCYCGKKGCLDGYCSSLTLLENSEQSLRQFFEKLETGDGECNRRWEEYLDHLALAVSNIRMIFDCDIILGGNVGGYMGGHIRAFESKVSKYNRSDLDTSYIRLGNYKEGSSAIGAAKHMVDKYISNLDKYIGN